MFQLGQTCGVSTTCKPDGAKTIEYIEDYVDSMAKNAEEIPEKSLAPTKVVEVTKGTFASSTDKIETTTDSLLSDSSNSASPSESADGGSGSACNGGLWGGDASSAAAAATNNAACAAKADTSSSCPGSTPTDACQGSSIIEKISPFATYEDPRTGWKLVKLVQPSIISDVLNSSYQAKRNEVKLSAAEFQRTYCDNNPYPECAACKLSKTSIDITSLDVHALLQSVADGIAAMMKFDIGLSGNPFNCPGQLAALCSDKLGPFGAIVGKAAAGALIGVTALRGAAASFRSLANTYMNTDLRREVMMGIGKIVKNGVLGGLFNNSGLSGASAITNELNKILSEAGCTADTFVRLMTTDKTPWSSFSNPGLTNELFSECGLSFISNGKVSNVFSDIRDKIDSISARKAKQALVDATKSLSVGASTADNPLGAVVSGSLIPVNSGTSTYTLSTDETVQDGTTYFKKDEDTGNYVKITDSDGNALEPGDSLDNARAQNGEIYTKEETGMESLTDPVKTDEPTAQPGKDYYYKDETTDEFTKVDVEPNQDLEPIREAHGDLYSKESESEPDATAVPDTVTEVQPGTAYYYLDETTGEYVKIDAAPGTSIAELKEKYGVDTLYSKPSDDPMPTEDTTVKDGTDYYYKDSATGELVKIKGLKSGDDLTKLKEQYGSLYSKASDDPTALVIDETSETKSGYTYWYLDENGQFVEIDVEPGEKLSDIFDELVSKGVISEGDSLYCKDDRPIASNDSVAVEGTKYYYLEDGVYKEIEIESGGDLDAWRTANPGKDVYSKVVDTPTYSATEDLIAQEGKAYFEIKDGVMVPLLDESGNPYEPGDTLPTDRTIFEKDIVVEGATDGAIVYQGSGPCILANGIMIREKVSLDSASYSNSIWTPGLVMNNGLLAADIAKLDGIGLSVYEIKVGLIVDSEQNGSVVPDDVQYERIVTILDSIADD